jgi:hypothetical protein
MASGYCLRLKDGGYLAASDNALYNFGVGDFTIESWVLPVSPGPIVSKKPTPGGANNGGYLFYVNVDGSMSFITDSGFGYYLINTAQSNVMNGVWHHVAAVRQSGVMKVYLDGVLLASTVVSSAPSPLNVNNSIRLCVGATDQTSQPNQRYSGLIDDLRIWNVARTVDDIQDNMMFQITGAEANLVAYWGFDAGLLGIDLSNTRNNASTIGTVLSTHPGAPIVPPKIPEGPATVTLQLFAGYYNTSSRWGGVYRPIWDTQPNLVITTGGRVIFGTQVITNPTFTGNGLSWPGLPTNYTAGNITFRLNSNDTFFWPSGFPSVNLFEGTIQYPNEGPLDYRGTVQDSLAPSTILQSCQTGFVLDAGTATDGTALTVKAHINDVNGDQRFCSTLAGFIQHVNSGLVLTNEGGTVRLRTQNLSNPNQKWVSNADHSISSAGGGVLTVQSGNVVVTTLSNPISMSQMWYSLKGRQQIVNSATQQVLTFNSYAVVVAAPNMLDARPQLWYLADNYIVYNLTCKVLTAVGSNLQLQDMDDANPAQKWFYSGNYFANGSSTSTLVLDIVNGNLVVAQKAANRPSQLWLLNTGSPQLNANMSAMAESLVASLQRVSLDTVTPLVNVDYEINIKTSSDWWSGMDDEVYVKLVGQYGSTGMLSIGTSLTYPNDPFERGQTDRFIFSKPDVGPLQQIWIHSGHPGNFGRTDDWRVDWVTVNDPTRLTQHTARIDAWMPFEGGWNFKYTTVLGSSTDVTSNHYPSQKGIITRRIISMDHTWVQAVNPNGAPNPIYFACAGGYQGDGSSFNTIPGLKGDLTKLVQMCTSQPISPSHPLVQIYGYNTSDPMVNAGISPGGYWNWDGQCHQIANRLLWMCSPQRTLADANPIPHAYGSSVFLFGVYGINMDSWCRTAGITPPLATMSDSIAEYLRRTTQYLAVEPLYNSIMYAANTLRGTWTDSVAGQPDGIYLKTFVIALAGHGLSVLQIARITGLTPEVINADLQ